MTAYPSNPAHTSMHVTGCANHTATRITRRVNAAEPARARDHAVRGQRTTARAAGHCGQPRRTTSPKRERRESRERSGSGVTPAPLGGAPALNLRAANLFSGSSRLATSAAVARAAPPQPPPPPLHRSCAPTTGRSSRGAGYTRRSRGCAKLGGAKHAGLGRGRTRPRPRRGEPRRARRGANRPVQVEVRPGHS